MEVSDHGQIAIGAGCVASDVDPALARCPLPPQPLTFTSWLSDPN